MSKCCVLNMASVLKDFTITNTFGRQVIPFGSGLYFTKIYIKNKMNKKLLNFIIKAKISTYAGAEDDSKKILSDGSKEFIYIEDIYEYRDRYFGSDPFAGQEVVFSVQEPIWVMNYRGYISDKTISEKAVYDFLKQALSEVSEATPFRGPAKLSRGDFEYTSEFLGNSESFSGVENIYFKNKKIYELFFHGGLVG